MCWLCLADTEPLFWLDQCFTELGECTLPPALYLVFPRHLFTSGCPNLTASRAACGHVSQGLESLLACWALLGARDSLGRAPAVLKLKDAVREDKYSSRTKQQLLGERGARCQEVGVVAGSLRMVREALPEAGGRGTVCAKALWLEGAEEGWREANKGSGGIVQHAPEEGRGTRGLAGIWDALKEFELRWGEHESIPFVLGCTEELIARGSRWVGGASWESISAQATAAGGSDEQRGGGGDPQLTCTLPAGRPLASQDFSLVHEAARVFW